MPRFEVKQSTKLQLASYSGLALLGQCYQAAEVRLLGQLGLTGELSPIRHPAKRRRIKIVLQKIIYRAAKYVQHARRRILDVGRDTAAHVDVFTAVQTHLRKAIGP